MRQGTVLFFIRKQDEERQEQRVFRGQKYKIPKVTGYSKPSASFYRETVNQFSRIKMC